MRATDSETPASAENGEGAAVRGVSAAYVGWRVWPRRSRIESPIPSLPDFGTESPPVATTTASASRGAAPSRWMRQRPAAGSSPVTATPARSSTPRSRARARSPSRTSRARLEAGKSLPVSGSSTSGIASSDSKNRICSGSGQERSMLRSVLGEESVTNRDSSARAGRMLQRPPPLIRILRPPSGVRSRSRVSTSAEAE
jgi:hypothetical protein